MSAPGDYSALNTQLVFTDGQTTGALVCATLDIINDTVVEENEESLTLSLTADDPPVTTITASSATVVTRENDNDGNLKYLSDPEKFLLILSPSHILPWP